MWREGLGVEYPADHSPYADPVLYYPPGKIALHTQNSTKEYSSKVSYKYLRQKHPTNTRITAEGWILEDRKSVKDSVGGLHRSMRAWKKFLGISNSYKARYDGGMYDLQEPTDVRKANQALVANLLDLATGSPATMSTLPPVASGNGLQDSLVEADPDQPQHGRSTNQQNSPTEVNVGEDIRQERLAKKVKRARRDELSHRDSTSSVVEASAPTTECGFCVSGCLLCAPQSFGPHYTPEELQQKRLERKKERRRDMNGARHRFRANLAEQRRRRCKE
jgi:hypothetical protein